MTSPKQITVYVTVGCSTQHWAVTLVSLQGRVATLKMWSGLWWWVYCQFTADSYNGGNLKILFVPTAVWSSHSHAQCGWLCYSYRTVKTFSEIDFRLDFVWEPFILFFSCPLCRLHSQNVCVVCRSVRFWHSLVKWTTCLSTYCKTGFPHLLESPGIAFIKFPRPGKSWKMEI